MNPFVLALLFASYGAPADTVVAMQRGDRVVFEDLSGELRLEAWSGGDLEVTSDDRRDAGVLVSRRGSQVIITQDDRKGRGRGVDVVVRVPEWADVEVRGQSLDVRSRGVGGALTVGTLRGDVMVEDAGGDVTVRTIRGEVTILGATGRVTASSRSDDVRLERVRGPVVVQAGHGDLHLIDVESSSIEAETQDGNIEFVGPILRGGAYGFFVHDGDATITIPESSGATVSVSTFDGDFESEFPVMVDRFTGGREFDFTVGDGNARLRIQVFDGEIRLLKHR